MTTLSVLKFKTSDGAQSALVSLGELAKQQLISVHDAAIVAWPEGKKKPKTEQLNNLKGAGAMSGAFWGMLFGLIFFVPFLGMALGAAAGALSGGLADVGINDRFIDDVKRNVTPGTSALFLLTSDAVQDKVIAEMKAHEPELITTNLSSEDEDRLRQAFADD
jgi:uncharacterized membrane protein